MDNGIDVFINIRSDECILCMGIIDTYDYERLCCGHHFCRSCICEWLETNHDCPLCYGENDVRDEFGLILTDDDVGDDSCRYEAELEDELKIYALCNNYLQIIDGTSILSYST